MKKTTNRTTTGSKTTKHRTKTTSGGRTDRHRRGVDRDSRRPVSTPPEAGERLQKLLAGAGLGSRRALEAKIADGAVRINGKRAELGARAVEGDSIQVDGRRFTVQAEPARHRTLIYHKPEGEVTTRSDPEGRRTVFDRLPKPPTGRWIAIGRLDLNTAGLLVLTTDGELANRMMHPSGNVDREYLCRIRGTVSDDDLARLLEGVELDDGVARFSDLVIGEETAGHTWYTVTIMEGRNREVRRLWDAVGAQVARLKRVRFGPVFLPAKLTPGRWQTLNPADHRVLREDVGLPGRATELIAVDNAKPEREPRPPRRRR